MPCAKCVLKGTTCTYGPTTQKIPAAVTSPKTNCSSVDNASTAEEKYSQTQTAASALTATSITTSHLNKAGETTSAHPDPLSDTSIMSSSSVSTRTPETIYSLQSSGLVYVQDPEVYQQQTGRTRPLESASQPSRTTNPSDYSSVAIYNSGFLNEPLAEVYSPTGSNPPHIDDQLAPISSHLSPAYGSDVFTPFFTDIFPQMTLTSALTEVTLNIDELNVNNSPENFPFDAQLYAESIPPAANQNSSLQTEILKPGAFQDFKVDSDTKRLRPVNVEPTPVELQHYCECRHSAIAILLMSSQCMSSLQHSWHKSRSYMHRLFERSRSRQSCSALCRHVEPYLLEPSGQPVSFTRHLLTLGKRLCMILLVLHSIPFVHAWTHVFAQARKSTDWLDQVQLILAVVLLQTIGLFHQDIDQRASSTIYHGMLVMVRVPSCQATSHWFISRRWSGNRYWSLAMQIGSHLV